MWYNTSRLKILAHVKTVLMKMSNLSWGLPSLKTIAHTFYMSEYVIMEHILNSTYATLNQNAYFRTVQTLTVIGPVRFQTAPTREVRKSY